MSKPPIAFLHYSASPVVGGVEAVMDAHARVFHQAGYPVCFIVGQGAVEAIPSGADFVAIPEVDSRHPEILAASSLLEQGEMPAFWEAIVERLVRQLAPRVVLADHIIVHNVLTKHFNLPLTAALFRLIDAGLIRHCIAWCHDFTWTSANSRSKVFSGHPWDLLRTYDSRITYVVVSAQRQQELAGLFGCAPECIRVVYNGVEPAELLHLSPTGQGLMTRLGLLDADLVLLMPVRVTQAKNIEYALQVVAALKAQGLAPKLVLTGPPDPHDPAALAYLRSLQGLRAELGVEDEMRFVFESGPESDEQFRISLAVVAELYRLADVVFMPSHREGFGMPVLEAGMAGVPVVATDVIPAATEIGGQHVLQFSLDQAPEDTAAQMLAWLTQTSTYPLRRIVRQRYTWGAIFRRDIEPLLHE